MPPNAGYQIFIAYGFMVSIWAGVQLPAQQVDQATEPADKQFFLLILRLKMKP